MSSTQSPRPPRGFFPIVFCTVVGLSVLSLVLAALFSFDADTPQRQQMFETCSTCWKLGFGAIVGLIGGKAM